MVRAGDGEAAITVFRHELRFRESLLPDSIVSLGESLSADPWSFLVEADGERLPLFASTPLTMTAEDSRGATLSWSGGNRLVSVMTSSHALAETGLIAIIIAAMAGARIPLMLHRFGIDPAVATGPFITTMNDIMGLFIYFLMGRLLYEIFV